MKIKTIGKLALFAAAAAGAVAYKKNPNIKEKMDVVGKDVIDLGKTSYEEIKKEVNEKKEELNEELFDSECCCEEDKINIE